MAKKNTRKGMISTSQVEIIKEKVTFNKPIPERFLAWCKCTINGGIIRDIVTDGTDKDVILKCQKQLIGKDQVKTVEVFILKLYEKCL